MKVTYAKYVTLKGKSYLQSHWDVIELPLIRRPFNYRNIISLISRLTGYPVGDIFIERIGGERMNSLIGFYEVKNISVK